MVIEKDISLKSHNTFGVDVSAKYFAEVLSTLELKELLQNKKFLEEQKLILGSGSNILFTKTFEGLVIKLNCASSKIIFEDDDQVIIRADAGIIWDEFVESNVKKGYWGAENLSAIPGTVGAAPIQNIGAYGVEVNSLIEKVNVLLLENLEEVSFNNDECKFGYRDSIFKNELAGKFVITSVEFRLFKNGKPNLNYEPLKLAFQNRKEDEISIDEIRDEIIKIRKSKIPDPNVIGNGGSFFKNPIIKKDKFDELKKNYPKIGGYFVDDLHVKISAAWLIDMCGLKGTRIGDVGIHDKQALIFVNYNSATGNEILSFSKMVKEKVFSKFKISLSEEVNVI